MRFVDKAWRVNFEDGKDDWHTKSYSRYVRAVRGGQSEKTYIFDRLAKCDRDGCPLDQLRQGELLFNPGLIYKEAS